MTGILVFDFEIFKYDSLLGVIEVSNNNKLVQIWGDKNILAYYNEHKDWLWIGHNNDFYDNHIIDAIIKGENVYARSKSIINGNRGKVHLDIITYDLMCCRFYSLKMTEMLIGKKVHTSDVDFNLDRPLTEEEKILENGYNEDDLLQTLHNFHELKDILTLRLNLINEFKIDKFYLTATEAKLATLALGAKQIPGIENMYVAPKIYDTLRLENKDVIDFYLREGFRKNEKLTVTLCGVEHQLGSGGIHGAVKKCHETDMLYLDVSGYYNLVMINYDLLPRTIPAEGKQLYEYMYHQQLALKGVNDDMRWVYKTILLAVFGASMNKYTDFYDPQIGSLITITGQLFLVDLLEKLEGKIRLVQSNTDGIIVKPLPTSSEDEVLAIVKEWCTRTGFVIKPKKIKEIFQRDVNCYCYLNYEGGTDTKGDAFVGSWAVDEPVKNEFYTSKEPAIIAKAVLAYFTKKILPEQTVAENKDNLLYYQYICKKLSYDYCTYETTDLKTGQTTSVRVDDLNRCFALKYDGSLNVIVKHKVNKGKLSHSKIANMPDNYFIYNDEIISDEGKAKVIEKLDYDFYVDRAYQRIREFVEIPMIKDVKL